MEKSHRHHYLPKFYIKGFTDTTGFLYVYDKEKSKFIGTKRSPKSVFYETDRNIVDFSGHKLDLLETMYAKLDSKTSMDLMQVLANKCFTPEELTSIAILANLLKWRVPKRDELFNKIKHDLTMDDLSIQIKMDAENMDDGVAALNHIESSDIYLASKRILLAMQPFIDLIDISNLYNYSFIESNNSYPSLIGDNPVIEMGDTRIGKIRDFIFPLSSRDTFIFKQDCKKRVNSLQFFLQKDLAILESSVRFVGCKSKEHLEFVIQLHDEIKTDLHTIDFTDKLFKYID